MAASFHHPCSCSLTAIAAGDAVGGDFGVGVDVAGAVVDAGVGFDVAAAAVDVDDLTSR